MRTTLAILTSYLCSLADFVSASSHNQPAFSEKDLHHPSRRRLSPRYLKKKSILKAVWALALGLWLLACPFNYAALMALTLLLTFLSFCVLDETD